MRKKVITLITFLIAAILIVAGAIFFVNFKKEKEDGNNNKKTAPIPDPVVQIVDLDSKTRPYAVMINNLYEARKVQSGLSQAYLVYELLAEGGITRFLALFRDVDVERIGSVRSARHYYLDYVLENDAIFVHWGWSPQAQADIGTLRLQNIHGLTYEGVYFYRDNPFGIAVEHTGFTNTELLDKARKNLNYPKDTEEGLLLKYSAKSVDINDSGETKTADNVKIFYSNYNEVEYEYDKDNKVYKRFINNQAHTDYNTGKQLTVKNIIVYDLAYVSIADDTKGRQNLNNIGNGTGYFITEGNAVKITWEKSSREAKTIYRYENGEEIVVNDGNTFIQIMPTNGSLEIS